MLGAWECPTFLLRHAGRLGTPLPNMCRCLRVPSELPDNKSMFQRAPRDSRLEKKIGGSSLYVPSARAGLHPTSFYVLGARHGSIPLVFTCFWHGQG